MSATGQCPSCNTPNEYSKVVCDFCGARLPWADAVVKAKPAPVQVVPVKSAVAIKPDAAINAAMLFGLLLLASGIIGLVYFFVVFETSVAVPRETIMGITVGGGRVNNIGLMQDRQNGLLMSMFLTVVGAVLYARNKPKSSGGGV